MKMSRLQRYFINKPENALKKAPFLDELLAEIDITAVGLALEVGSGPGYMASHLNEKYGISVVGTDVDPEEVRFARETCGDKEGLSFLTADAMALPFADAHFDLVFSHMVLHHIPIWRDALLEMVRVLKPGGYYLFHDLTYSRLLTLLFKPVLRSHAFYSIEEVKIVFTELNLRLVYEAAPGTYGYNQFTEYNIALQKSRTAGIMMSDG